MDQDKLYEIVQKSNDLAEALLETGGEITPELEASLDTVFKALVAKVDACGIVLERMEMEEDLWRQRAEKYMRIAKGLSEARERFRAYIKHCMITGLNSELSGDEIRFSLVRGKPKLVINETMIDPFYQKKEVRIVTDKEKVLEALNAGKQVPGASLEEVIQLRQYLAKRKK